jgi:putative serine protease PepD
MDNIIARPSLVRADGQEIPIDQPVIIGRQPECTIQVDDTRVSRQHARVEVTPGGVLVSDLGSQNGTFLNEKKLTAPAILKHGDRLRVGRSVFVFKAAPRVVPPPAPAPAEVKAAAPVEVKAAVPAEIKAVVEPPPPAPEVREGETKMWQNVSPMALVRGDGAEFGLNSDMQLGRDPGNAIVLEKDKSASGNHARLQLVNGEVILTDLKSSNGTWVNGKRIAQPQLLRHGDRIRVGNTIFRLRVGDQRLPPLDAAAQPAQPAKGLWKTSAGVALGVTMIVILCVGVVALGVKFIPPMLGMATPTLSAGSEATQAYLAKQTALRAVVWIIVPGPDTEETGMYSTGSGSLLNEDGYVLTNHHVIADNIDIFYIGLNWNDITAEPDTFYQCELVKASAQLDLAILHVIGDEDGRSLPGDLVFPFLPVGDSDAVRIGDSVTIIGYPGIGGNTPTMTIGSVSGFSPDEYNDLQNGWIKTDALISWGNSGGMAVNSRGELIGVPTQFTEESMEEKPLDTFLGLLRPINIAVQFIGSAVDLP